MSGRYVVEGIEVSYADFVLGFVLGLLVATGTGLLLVRRYRR